MKVYLLIILLLFTNSGCTYINNTDNVFKLSVGLIALDWYQTKNFIAAGDSEQNPVLGARPTQTEIDTKICIGVITYTFMYNRLKTSLYKTILVYGVLTGESLAVVHNAQAGYGIKINLGF